MVDQFDGDPFITIRPDGSDYIIRGGQPVMDQGLVNHVNMSLLTEPDWWGNDIEPIAERKVGSRFIVAAREPITRQSLLDTNKAAIQDVQGDEFADVQATTTNPVTQQLRLELLLIPPSNELQTLVLTRVGQNWINQKNNPAGDSEQETPTGPSDGVVYVFKELLDENDNVLLDENNDKLLAQVEK